MNRGWNRNKYPFDQGADTDALVHAIICRKFEEFFIYEDYTFGALTYYVKVLFSNRNKHYSKGVADKIGKIGPLTHDDLKGVKGLVWEHTIPTKVIVEYALYLYLENRFNVEDFCRVRDTYGTTCIVTKKEDEKISGEHLKQSLPSICQKMEIIREKYPKDKFAKMPEKVYDLETRDDYFVRYRGIIEHFPCTS